MSEVVVLVALLPGIAPSPGNRFSTVRIGQIVTFFHSVAFLLLIVTHPISTCPARFLM